MTREKEKNGMVGKGFGFTQLLLAKSDDLCFVARINTFYSFRTHFLPLSPINFPYDKTNFAFSLSFPVHKKWLFRFKNDSFGFETWEIVNLAKINGFASFVSQKMWWQSAFHFGFSSIFFFSHSLLSFAAKCCRSFMLEFSRPHTYEMCVSFFVWHIKHGAALCSLFAYAVFVI